MLNTVNNLSRADLQNIDTRATSAKDELFIFADLKQTNAKDENKYDCAIHVDGGFIYYTVATNQHPLTKSRCQLHDSVIRSVTTKFQRVSS